MTNVNPTIINNSIQQNSINNSIINDVTGLNNPNTGRNCRIRKKGKPRSNCTLDILQFKRFEQIESKRVEQIYHGNHWSPTFWYRNQCSSENLMPDDVRQRGGGDASAEEWLQVQMKPHLLTKCSLPVVWPSF